MIEALIFAVSPPAAQVSEPCAPPSKDAAAVWWFEPLERPPGASVSLEANWTDRPGSFEPIPQRCVRDIAVSPAGMARLGADGASITLADDAPSAAVVTLTG